MTCIVGINTGRKIIIAGDRMGSNGFTYLQDKKPKVFKKGNFIFGISGSYRVMQIIANNFEAPKRFVGQETDDYIYNTVTNYIFRLLDSNNALALVDGEKSFGGTVFIGYEKELYKLCSNFQININSKNYDTTGSGTHHAMASLYSTAGLDITHEDRLRKAIVCASEFVLSVDSDIDIVELVYDESPITPSVLPNEENADKKLVPPAVPAEYRPVSM